MGTKATEGKLDIRLEMLQLALRIVEATTSAGVEGRSMRHNLWDLLERLLKTMEAGQNLRPPFQGTVEGFNTVKLNSSNELRRIVFYGRDRRKNSEPQLQWEVSLWESMFPGATPSEVPLRRDPTLMMIHVPIRKRMRKVRRKGGPSKPPSWNIFT
jgi:hypothetical protein